MVEVYVRDTGHGISPSVMGQLFQPFMTTKAQGMGVGLSIANGIWRRVIDDYTPIARADEIDAAIEDYIARGTAAGGAEPES